MKKSSLINNKQPLWKRSAKFLIHATSHFFHHHAIFLLTYSQLSDEATTGSEFNLNKLRHFKYTRSITFLRSLVWFRSLSLFVSYLCIIFHAFSTVNHQFYIKSYGTSQINEEEVAGRERERERKGSFHLILLTKSETF